jgi:flavin-dependent dehydrogenase
MMTIPLQYEVVIVGAGPAGSATAIRLAATRSVLLVDRNAHSTPRIGEALHPESRRLFAQLGVLEAMTGQKHAVCFANRSVWGSDRPFDQEFIRHPDGAGWLLDRARFDQWLRSEAEARGVVYAAPARIEGLARRDNGWAAEFIDQNGHRELTARFVVDATGRRSSIARSLGIERTYDEHDRLACGWVHLRADSTRGAGVTIIEATADGWWYSAPLPTGMRVLAFHTDSDLPAARIAAEPVALPAHASGTTKELAQVLALRQDIAVVASGFVAAHGVFLQQATGARWLAVGDAVLATDPVAARGLLHALHTGIEAATAIERTLGGDGMALNAYAATVSRLLDDYRRNRRYCYLQERRFPDSLFWRRRQDAA